LVGVRERNLFGTELIGRAELTGSFRGAEALVGVTDPWFLRTDWTLDVPLAVLRREEPAFTIQEIKLEPRLSQPLTDQLTAGLGYRYVLSHVESQSAEPLTEFKEEPNLVVGALGPFAVLDTRNDLFVPSKGGLTKVSVEAGSPIFGGEISFIHPSIST